ncbi:MAG: SDR family NAD(P)-dependent oxidoreductase [Acidimicrobiales bacterium]|nr:SDR family NAD(P)-dependent oxidoreductase [Hyphomonadaceae bacterium]RZV42161.1 MAG: SDR family NAD(P)-dependent oxidoreductase [Acidimicrobiales bacterium]
MPKKILITGSTDGIGLEAAKILAGAGHSILLHGRNAEKLAAVKASDPVFSNADTYRADLSDLAEVADMAASISNDHSHLDVVINNAGVFKTSTTTTGYGLDIRYIVNTVAPYLLTQRLLPLMDRTGRVINLSSAAQAPVETGFTHGTTAMDHGNAYAQSKLAITMWTRHLSEVNSEGPAFISVNPGSLLGTKMVKESYGMAGKDIGIGADILVKLATDSAFDDANGLYFDNDRGAFGSPHPDALKAQKSSELVALIETQITELLKEE